jgi:hypothetical protein
MKNYIIYSSSHNAFYVDGFGFASGKVSGASVWTKDEANSIVQHMIEWNRGNPVILPLNFRAEYQSNK